MVVCSTHTRETIFFLCLICEIFLPGPAFACRACRRYLTERWESKPFRQKPLRIGFLPSGVEHGLSRYTHVGGG